MNSGSSQLHEDYRDKGVALVAISPNDPLAVRLDELGYTDVGDSFEDMKVHAQAARLHVPVLVRRRDPARLDRVRRPGHASCFHLRPRARLRYNGRIDDADITPPKSHDARNAIDALLAGKPVSVPKTRVFGCSTKWADKRDSATESIEKWNAEPVELKSIDADGLRKLAANETENFRLINLWSITCAPCITELPEFVTANRMYRGRHFEMITLTTDPPEQHEACLEILKQNHVSCTNYIFHSENRDELAEALDPKWEGPVPYTILIAPGGEIVRRWKDEIEPSDLKNEISTRLGKTYASRK